MSLIKSVFRTASINLVLIFFIIGFFVSAPIFFLAVYDFYQKYNPLLEDGDVLSANTKLDKRYRLPNYNGVEWAKVNFEERKLLTTTYYDFFVWRRDSFKGQTININENGIRHTFQSSDLNGQQEIWMFGGSTMWGNGVDDDNTIPSKVAKLTSYKVKNYGEAGYIARQSLNMLIKAYSESPEINRTIIFYDGVNDGAGHCRSGNESISTARQQQIQRIVKDYSENKVDALSFSYLFAPAMAFVKKIKEKLGIKEKYQKEEGWNCNTDKERAKNIAKSLVNDWVIASNMAKNNGDRFIAILQPVAFLSHTKLDHLDEIGKGLESIAVKGNQYKAVYPYIREYATNAGIEFYDMSTAFDVNEYIYIDFCHVSPNGNEIIAKKIADVL